MNITFTGPTYFCTEDEDMFFNWIYSLPEYESVKGELRELTLILKEPISLDSTIQLQTIFRRWEIDMEPLRVLKTPENEKIAMWDEKAYRTIK